MKRHFDITLIGLLTKMLLFWNKKFALEVEVERKIVESRELDLGLG